MKKIVLAAFAAAVASPAVAAPGDTATTQGEAVAEIVAPIAITHDGGALDFGVIAVDATAGSVTVSATTGLVTAETGGAASVVGSVTSADTFTVTGDADRSYSIVTTGGTLAGPGTDMTFTTTTNKASGTLTGGTDGFSVGGTLSVGASQAGGSYSGQYDATVTYN